MYVVVCFMELHKFEQIKERIHPIVVYFENGVCQFDPPDKFCGGIGKGGRIVFDR